MARKRQRKRARKRSERKYENIYLGPNSYFKIPKPRNVYKKALYNIAAQAIDFADGRTVDHSGRVRPFVYTKAKDR